MLNSSPTPASTTVRKDLPPSGVKATAPHVVLPHVHDRVALLDPESILIPAVPNRAEEAYSDESFQQLTRSISAAGGNVQAIHVREVVQPDGSIRYELVAGQRRVMACIDARVKVRAVIEAGLGDGEALLKRLHENRARADLAPLEFGWQVKHVLDSNAGFTQRTLAKALGCSEAAVSRALDLARLPAAVVDTFPSVHDIRYEDVKPLKVALKENQSAVFEEAQRIRSEQGVPGREIVRRLLNAAKPQLAPCKSDPKLRTPLVGSAGTALGEWGVNAVGALELTINASMSDVQRKALAEQVGIFLERKVFGQKSVKLAAASNDSATHGPASQTKHEAALAP